MRLCPVCVTEKELTEFHKSKDRPQGVSWECKECAKARHRERYKDPEIRAQVKAAHDKYWQTEAGQLAKRKQYLRRHGITIEQYEAILKAQGGKCALCRVEASSIPARRMHVDHDHRCCDGNRNNQNCGKCVRGILCVTCNNRLGGAEKMRDSGLNWEAYSNQAVDLERNLLR